MYLLSFLTHLGPPWPNVGNFDPFWIIWAFFGSVPQLKMRSYAQMLCLFFNFKTLICLNLVHHDLTCKRWAKWKHVKMLNVSNRCWRHFWRYVSINYMKLQMDHLTVVYQSSIIEKTARVQRSHWWIFYEIRLNLPCSFL